MTTVYKLGHSCPHGIPYTLTVHPPKDGLVLESEGVDCEKCRADYTDKLTDLIATLRADVAR